MQGSPSRRLVISGGVQLSFDTHHVTCYLDSDRIQFVPNQSLITESTADLLERIRDDFLTVNHLQHLCLRGGHFRTGAVKGES